MMTEAEFFERVLEIKEIRVDRIDWQEQSLHVYCSSIFEEALCPHCLNKRQVVHQTYERQFRDLSITGKEVYLHWFFVSFCGGRARWRVVAEIINIATS